MTIQKLNPYLKFNGTAREALRLYERALGAQAGYLLRYGEMQGCDPRAAHADRILHADVQIGGANLMLCDTPPDQPVDVGRNADVVLHFADLGDMRARFDALAEGGSVTMPIHQAFWGDHFGALTDAHGVGWMFNCPKPS